MLLKDAGFCVIDLETTGLDIAADEIIAFASLPMSGTRITVHEGFYTLIKPRKYKLETMKYHGISRLDLMNAPCFEDLSTKILQSLGGVIVGHCVEFDHGFLKKHFKRAGIRFKRECLDIAQIEAWLGGECGTKCSDFSLDSMTSGYGLRGNFRHNAMADAFFTAQIFQMQIKRLAELRIDSIWTLKHEMKRCQFPVW